MLIKTAILMPEAQEGEVTILEVETLGFGKAKVNFVQELLMIANKINFSLGGVKLIESA